LQAMALPLNGWRLYQMVVLIGNVREAVRGKPSLDWLKPFMSDRHFRKGDLLFAKGETAAEMFYIMTGRYVLAELGVEIAPGHLAGELAMLAPDNRRTATFECIEEGNVLSITYEQVEEPEPDLRLLIPQARHRATVRQCEPHGKRIGKATNGRRRGHRRSLTFVPPP